MNSRLDVSKATPEGMAAFAEILLYIRDQAGEEYGLPVTNWETFVDLAAKEGVVRYPAGEMYLSLPLSTLKNLAGRKMTTMPNAGFLFALEAWGIFTFRNGERLTALRLFDVVYGFRDASGNLRQPTNDEPSSVT